MSSGKEVLSADPRDTAACAVVSAIYIAAKAFSSSDKSEKVPGEVVIGRRGRVPKNCEPPEGDLVLEYTNEIRGLHFKSHSTYGNLYSIRRQWQTEGSHTILFHHNIVEHPDRLLGFIYEILAVLRKRRDARAAAKRVKPAATTQGPLLKAELLEA